MRRHAIPAAALWAALCVCVAGSVGAQGTAVPFGGLVQDTALPVEITADRLEVVQETGAAVFTGGVVASQGGMRLAADRVEVIYADKAAGGAVTGEAGAIESLRATGGVTLTSGGEAAEADTALYTIATGAVTMTGDVLLTRAGSAISGDRLVVDLATGRAVIEGRVTTVLQPAGDR